jgi:hypothetical protein
MNIIDTAPTGYTSVPLDAFDKATDALDKAEAILTTLSAVYDEEAGFIPTDKFVQLTLLAACDLVGTARGSLTAELLPKR